MDMKQHILAALRELLQRWEDLLASIDEEKITAPLLPSPWSIKNIIAHLMVWQQRTIARVAAADEDREPELPVWIPGLDPDTEGGADLVNAWIYEKYRDQAWPEVRQNWKDGFQRFLELAERISERDLLDGGRYPWLNGFSLALILLASYDHHQEHYENLLAWLREHGETASNV